MEQIRGAYPNYTEDQLSALKENEFVNWLKFYVRFLLSRGDPIQPWLEELALGPKFIWRPEVENHPCSSAFDFD
ncbi:hypothetical protein HID58_094438, partial [Brassica napus]